MWGYPTKYFEIRSKFQRGGRIVGVKLQMFLQLFTI